MVLMKSQHVRLIPTTSRTGKAILCVHIKPSCVMPSRSMIRTQDGIETLSDCVIGHTVRYRDNRE